MAAKGKGTWFPFPKHCVFILSAVLLGCKSLPAKRAVASESKCAGNASLAMPFDHFVGGESFSYIYQRRIVDPQGPTFIFLPGGPGDGSIGRRSVPESLNAIMIDPRGVGCNANDKIHGDLLLSRQAVMDIVTLIRALKLTNYFLYGESFGTVTATMVADEIYKEGLPEPRAVILEGIIGKSFTWERWNAEHLAIANRLIQSDPKIKSLFHQPQLPLGLPAEFWGNELYFSGYHWATEKSYFKHLAANKWLGTAAFQANYQYWKASPARMAPDAIYLDISCRELSPTCTGIPVSTVIEGQVRIAAMSEDFCAGRNFDHPYDSAKYQIHAPIIYFQGSTDPTTPIASARYHFDHQISAPLKKFIVITEGSHNPLSENLSSCNRDLFNGMAVGNFDLEKMLTSDGWCLQTPAK